MPASPATSTLGRSRASADVVWSGALRAYALWPSWAVLILVALTASLHPALPEWVVYFPLAASLVFLGLPHGAMDHLIKARLVQKNGKPARLRQIILVYVAVAATYLALWFVAPAYAFLLFIAMTWVHWGQGDLYSLLTFSRAQHLSARWLRGLAVFVRGGLPMLVPLLAFPEVYREFASLMTSTIAPGALESVSTIFEDRFRRTAGGAFAVAVSLYLVSTRLSLPTEDTSAWQEDALEILLLFGFFCLVHPVLAIGIYFCIWHSLRHICRIVARPEYLAVDRTSSLRDRLIAVGRAALPTTTASIILLGGLYLLVPNGPTTLPELVALYLVLISVLTLPHIGVVWDMDRYEGLWSRELG